MACALLNVSYGISDMNPPRLMPEVLAVLDKIRLIPDESMENRTRYQGNTSENHFERWKTIEETVLEPKGDSENPLTRNDTIEKLIICARRQADSQVSEKFINGIYVIKGMAPFTTQ